MTVPASGNIRPARISARFAGIAAAAVAVTIWGCASVLVKSVDEFDGVGVSFHRIVSGSVLLSVVFVARGGRFTRSMLVTCIPGGVAFGADIILFFSALRETSVANATVIGALQPIILLPLGIRWFGDRTDRTGVIFSVVAVAATAVVVLGNTEEATWSPKGDVLAVGALGTWCAYFLASRRARRTLGALEYFTGLTLVASLIVVPYALLTSADISSGRVSDWVAVGAITLFSGAIGHVLLNWAHGQVSLQVVSVLTLLVPVVATTGAAAFLGESVNGVQIGGIAAVMVALVIVVRHSFGGTDSEVASPVVPAAGPGDAGSGEPGPAPVASP